MTIGELTKHHREKPAIFIKEIHTLSSYALIHSLWERRIPQNVAQKYCREVTYTVGPHTRYAIGFPCDAGGYVLWSGNFIGASEPVSITYIASQSSNILAVFPYFLDFLSFLVIAGYQEEDLPNFLILNDPALFNSSRDILHRHGHVYLFPANDSTGDHWFTQATEWSIVYSDMRHLYKNYHGLNDWCCQGSFRGPSGRSSVPIHSDGLSP
jgi:hypothetical protein